MPNTYSSGDTSQLGSREIAGRLQLLIEEAPDTGWPFEISLYNSDSDQESESYSGMTAAPSMKKWRNGRRVRMLGATKTIIFNEHYEATLEDFIQNWRRDKTGLMRQRVSQLQQRSTSHWKSLLTDLMEAGDSTTVGDGQNFFSASHSEGDSGTQKNLLTASDVSSLNVASALAPTPEEMAKILIDLALYFRRYKDDVGEPINEDANMFHVHVPTVMGSPLAQAITKNMLATSSGGAVDNPLRDTGITIVPHANPRLDNTAAEIYMFRSDAPEAKPFIMQQEGELSVNELAEGSDLEFTENKWQFGVDAWRGVGYGMWQTALQATLS